MNDNNEHLKYLRSKAVNDAWLYEVELVKNGHGTRQWTLAEQIELLTIGRIKGYYGHHIKGVKDYPALAGEKDNIQFLTFSEHLKVHFGCWKLSINHFYDYQIRSISLSKQNDRLLESKPIYQLNKPFVFLHNPIRKGVESVYQITQNYRTLSLEERKIYDRLRESYLAKYETERKSWNKQFFSADSQKILPVDISLMTGLRDPEMCGEIIKQYRQGKQDSPLIQSFISFCATQAVLEEEKEKNRQLNRNTLDYTVGFKLFAEDRYNRLALEAEQCKNEAKNALELQNQEKYKDLKYQSALCAITAHEWARVGGVPVEAQINRHQKANGRTQ